MGMLTAILLQTMARTTVAGAAVVAERQQARHPAPAPKARKRTGGGCSPCKALKTIDKARRAAGLPVAPPLSAAEAKRAGVKVR